MLVALRQLQRIGSWHNDCFLSQTCIASCRCINGYEEFSTCFSLRNGLFFLLLRKNM